MKEIMTFKSGKFYFCDGYDQALITNLLVRAMVLNETVVDLPILPELSSRLEPDIMYSSISGTAMIEGNAITGEDVKRIAAGEDIENVYTQRQTRNQEFNPSILLVVQSGTIGTAVHVDRRNH